MKLTDVYKKSIKKKWLVRLKTKHPDGDCYDGIVLKETKDFVVLYSLNDFEQDGIVVLAKKFISGFRDGKFEKCFNAIVRFNGQFKKVRMPKWLAKCETFEDVFRKCLKLEIWPCIEILLKFRKLKSDFYLGKVVKGNESQVLFQGYDATGKWEKETIIEFDEILRIGFNRYTAHFNAFMKSRQKK